MIDVRSFGVNHNNSHPTPLRRGGQWGKGMHPYPFCPIEIICEHKFATRAHIAFDYLH